MKTQNILAKSLVVVLDDLKKIPHTFAGCVDALFEYGYEEFDLLFQLRSVAVEAASYKRIPVLQSDGCVAVLMVWGSENHTAIHDHKNYDGRIKVLKGSLTEVKYRENSNFIEYDGVSTAHEGDVFPEESGIHSIINQADGVSVSLHVYRTSQLHLNGVRIFDTEKRKVALLNSKASHCSWKLPEEAYDEVLQL